MKGMTPKEYEGLGKPKGNACPHSGLDRAEYDLSFASGDGKLDWCAECGAVRVRDLKPRTAAMGDHYPQFAEGEWVSPVRAKENAGRKMQARRR